MSMKNRPRRLPGRCPARPEIASRPAVLYKKRDMETNSPPDPFQRLCRRLGYRFKNPGRLHEAFRHSSFVNEQVGAGLQDNERLEFLGDAVLDLAISHQLMERFPEAREGDLSRCRAAVVDEQSLAEVGRELGLGEYLLLGKGETQSSGHEKPSILADAVEALLGALYLDAGFARTARAIARLFGPRLDKVRALEPVHDSKSQLQEYTQKHFRSLPSYRLVRESGPAHDRTFEVALLLDGEILSSGSGRSKKDAEQVAAREALACLNPL